MHIYANINYINNTFINTTTAITTTTNNNYSLLLIVKCMELVLYATSTGVTHQPAELLSQVISKLSSNNFSEHELLSVISANDLPTMT